ncbi:flagellin [Priestia megaterium]|uniref:flagellin N-terminal helical domain-containing protein n=1 Tax=Priestia megaterium TaxID=1404 RepID=UPI002E24C64D|nr:flagellin [Priestia megaterium]MED3878781.1 flagellin [Priestia megaterium]
MRINHNITALNTYRQFNNANNAQSKSMEKLSSGLRINSAADDAAGLAISEKMRGQIRGLDVASRNAQDGVSMVQTAEGALNETQDILQRMRELSVQASNDTNTADDRNEIQKEIGQLNSEVDRIAGSTEFNTQKLLNGSLGASATSSDATHVAVVSSTGLKAGNYTVTVDTAATKATLTGSVAYASDTAVNTAFGAADKDITVNGVQIDTTGTTTGAALVTALNAKKEETGFTASWTANQGVKFTANEFGSGKTLTFGGANSALLDSGTNITQGKDAVATIAGPDDTKVVTGTGQKLVYGTAEFTATATADAQFATVKVASAGVSLQTGANKDQNMIIDINQMDTNTLGNSTDKIKDVNVLTTAGANKAIKTVDDAIKQVSSERSKLGAFQNRLDHTINNLSTSSENLTSAESRIRDVDYALAA